MSCFTPAMGDAPEFLPRLVAVFFATFDKDLGPHIVYQVPEGSVATQSSASTNADEQKEGSPDIVGPRTLFEFSSVVDYVIPKNALCGRLVTVCTQDHKILGFPVAVNFEGYDRNNYTFNLAFVFDRAAELAAYEPVVRKTGRVLGMLEESSSFLSRPGSSARMQSILEQVYEDLNSYSETSIPLDSANILDLKLIPIFPNPTPVRDWDVPVPLIDLEGMKDFSWDLTLYRLSPYIDGVRSVRRAADLADVDHALARECIQHLVYYGAVVLVDLFQYSNSYTLIGGFTGLATIVGEELDEHADLAAEAESYVCPTEQIIPFPTLASYYAKLHPSLTVSEWMEENAIHLTNLDVRRFISFGMIKGFLRRVHAYPVLLPHPSISSVDDVYAVSSSEEDGDMNSYRSRMERFESRKSSVSARYRASDFGSQQQGDRTIRRTSSLQLWNPPAHNSTTLAAAPAPPSSRASSIARTPSYQFPAPAQTSLAANATPPPSGSKPGPKTQTPAGLGYPPLLPSLLDGTHHDDELCTRFRVGFSQLKQMLNNLGEDLGRKGIPSGPVHEHSCGGGRIQIIFTA